MSAQQEEFEAAVAKRLLEKGMGHSFNKTSMEALVNALDGWDELDSHGRSSRNKMLGMNKAYKLCSKLEKLGLCRLSGSGRCYVIQGLGW